jgi:hypothetical protein
VSALFAKEGVRMEMSKKIRINLAQTDVNFIPAIG